MLAKYNIEFDERYIWDLVALYNRFAVERKGGMKVPQGARSAIPAFVMEPLRAKDNQSNGIDRLNVGAFLVMQSYRRDQAFRGSH